MAATKPYDDDADDLEAIEVDESSEEGQKPFEDTRVGVRLKQSLLIVDYWQKGFAGFKGDRMTIYKYHDSDKDVILSTKLTGATVKQYKESVARPIEGRVALKIKTKKLTFCLQSGFCSKLQSWIEEIANGSLHVVERQKVFRTQKKTVKKKRSQIESESDSSSAESSVEKVKTKARPAKGINEEDIGAGLIHDQKPDQSSKSVIVKDGFVVDKLIGTGEKLVDADIPIIDRSITKLNIYKATQLTDNSIPYLPPNILYMDISQNTNLTNSCISVLPRTLTHLDLRFNPNLNSEYFLDLPRNLTFLDVSGAKIATDDLKNLPQSLQTLILHRESTLTDEAISILPRTLTHLDMHANSKLTSDCIPYLPQSLTRLELPGSKISDLNLDLLPKTLVWLSFWYNSGITDAGIAVLPKSLTRLELGSNSIITNKCIGTLPRGLRHLNLKKAPLTSACLDYLPRTLTYLGTSMSPSTVNAKLPKLKVNKFGP